MKNYTEKIDKIAEIYLNTRLTKKAGIVDSIRDRLSNVQLDPELKKLLHSALVGAGIGGLSSLLLSREKHLRNAILGALLGGAAGAGLHGSYKFTTTPVALKLSPELAKEVVDQSQSQADKYYRWVKRLLPGTLPLSYYISQALSNVAHIKNLAREANEVDQIQLLKELRESGYLPQALRKLKSDASISAVKERYVAPLYAKRIAQRLQGSDLWTKLKYGFGLGYVPKNVREQAAIDVAKDFRSALDAENIAKAVIHKNLVDPVTRRFVTKSLLSRAPAIAGLKGLPAGALLAAALAYGLS